MPSSGVQTCARSEEHTSELQSHDNLVCRLLLEKNNAQFRRERRRRWGQLRRPHSEGVLARAAGGGGARPVAVGAGAAAREATARFFFWSITAAPKRYTLPLQAPLRI